MPRSGKPFQHAAEGFFMTEICAGKGRVKDLFHNLPDKF